VNPRAIWIPFWGLIGIRFFAHAANALAYFGEDIGAMIALVDGALFSLPA
jgi:hypothetical protein